MTRYLRFTSPVVLQKFVRHQAMQWADWRKLELRREPDVGAFVLRIPDAAKLRPGDERLLIAAPPSDAAGGKCVLGDLWRWARPVLRGAAERDAPTCWLLLLQGSEPAACDLLIDAAPDGFDLLELEGSENGGQRMLACVVRGEAGRMLAQAPPEGVTPFECDELPGGGLAALPSGWGSPRMLAELWPQGADRVVLYEVEANGEWRARECFVVNRIPLAQLVEAKPLPIQSLDDLTRDIRPARWRVVRNASAALEEARDLDSVECWRVVFRIKTYDAGADPLSSGDSRGHELGLAFLQVLDECEAGLLPKILYSAVDISEAERWHFLYTDRADNRLIDAWSMLDRFDLVPEAAERGLCVFVSSMSRMIPPIRAMLASAASRGDVVDRIRALVGSPTPETLVLIEDLETVGAASPKDWSERAVNPRVIHVDLAKAKPLAELLPRLVAHWNNAEPMQALAQSSGPAAVSELRREYEERLRKIAVDEEESLRVAAERSHFALEEWASQAAAAIARAAAPVREAREVCTDLESALSAGSASFIQACQGLARFCSVLTKPRREWTAEQLRQNAQAVAEAAPSANEADAVRNAAETMRNELDSQSATLRRAIEAIETLERRLAASEREAAAVSSDAQRSRERVLARAESAMQRIGAQMQEVQANLGAALEVQAQIQAEMTRLEVARNDLMQLELENLRMRKSNEQLAADNRRRARVADADRKAIDRILAVEVPRLERSAAEAEQRLAALDPRGVAARHQKATDEWKQVQAALRGAEDQLAAIKNMADATRSDRTLVEDKRAELENAGNAHKQAMDELQRAEVDLKEAIADVNRRRAMGSKDSLDARIRIARQALEQISGPLPRRGVLTRVWRAIVGRRP